LNKSIAAVNTAALGRKFDSGGKCRTATAVFVVVVAVHHE